METIANLQAFLDHLSAETPWQAGRNLYKYTACGPWTRYVVQDAPARENSYSLLIARDGDGKLRVMANVPPAQDMPLPPDDVLSRFGFNQDGSVHRDYRYLCKSLKGYAEMLRRFQGNLTPGKDLEITLIHEGPTDPRPGERRWIMLAITHRVPQETRTVYYESEEANSPLENCVGVEIGSIVEGSDVEIGPEYLPFPFTGEDLDKTIEGINSEADFYWRRDNITGYHVTYQGEDYYFEHDEEDCFDELPEAIRAAVRKAVEDDELDSVPDVAIEEIDKGFMVY